MKSPYQKLPLSSPQLFTTKQSYFMFNLSSKRKVWEKQFTFTTNKDYSATWTELPELRIVSSEFETQKAKERREGCLFLVGFLFSKGTTLPRSFRCKYFNLILSLTSYLAPPAQHASFLCPALEDKAGKICICAPYHRHYITRPKGLWSYPSETCKP